LINIGSVAKKTGKGVNAYAAAQAVDTISQKIGVSGGCGSQIDLRNKGTLTALGACRPLTLRP